METRYVRTGDKTYLQMTKFWSKVFLINFALGVVTGITLEFQFGTNWSKYSAYVGDIFGSLLAIEASVAFFLESTLIGIWVFGWKKLSPKVHAIVMWLVALGSNMSALWIMVANGWMQHPVGFDFVNGRAELNDFAAVIFNKFAILIFLHVIAAAILLSSFVVMGISAYHLLKKQEVDFFTRSFNMALIFGLISSIVVVIEGDQHAVHVTQTQPAKLAAMEAHWETSRRAPILLFAIPDQEKEKNIIEIGKLPGLLSFLGYHDFNAEVKGLKDFPKEERPPVLLTMVAFRVMVGLGTLFPILMIIGFFIRKRLMENPWYLRAMLFALPLPYIANEAGWFLAEVGRQPWIVYGMMKTADAVSPISASQVGFSLLGFILIYGLLGFAGIFLIATHAKKGPEAASA
jgi:cytochrome d ubiquinol oxidase subunit I